MDDDPAVRRMLRRVLEGEGYTVETAADGIEAVDIAAGSVPDLVLLDLNMPARDGWDTFGRLMKDHPSLSVIIITARPNQVFPALASGAGALMEKPLDLPKLLRTMHDLLAEPVRTRLARLHGQPAEFRYLPPKPRETAGTTA